MPTFGELYSKVHERITGAKAKEAAANLEYADRPIPKEWNDNMDQVCEEIARLFQEQNKGQKATSEQVKKFVDDVANNPGLIKGGAVNAKGAVNTRKM